MTRPTRANEPSRLLAIGAHPDDIEFGCGAVLLKEAALGTRLQMLVCSRGEAGSNGTSEIRTKETQAAAAQLGAELRFTDLGGDSQIESRKKGSNQIAFIIRSFRPHCVLAPTLEENQHPDHSAVARMVRDAARLARYGGVAALSDLDSWSIDALYHYAIAPGGEPLGQLPVFVDVSAYRSAWVDLMQAHTSQLRTRNYIDLQLARARVHGLQIGADLAVGLYSSDPVVLENLTASGRCARQF